ncbi:carbohydrate sulfotransferase 11-like isoform X2 [Homarus americanus]|uniref:carbohydrate sulfotransferase 11-like isoform X2 n=1 Tax=Homarus americanus TaxID=6706 RepID=UPI001C43C325|nr:carbohydrate sulfotransferase 11-like isoform X2 [Homarus americanus]XP_042205450.1 carbohydrate sulfotransferase 11-like isoform X2 [Homarus americanus]
MEGALSMPVGRGGRQMLMVLVVAVMMLLGYSILYPDNPTGISAISFTADQLKFLQAYALPGDFKNDTVSVTTPGPKERSKALTKHVNDACRTLNISLPISSFMLSHMHFDDKRKAIYCFIPKVACTSWKRVWMKTTGIVPPDQDLALIGRYTVHTRVPLLSATKESMEKLNTYKKFLFVRHPFDRVLSAYKDKLENVDRQSSYNFHKEIGEKIEKKYRGTKDSHGDNVTFSEFIRFISEPGHGTFEQRNEHWLSMHEICNPCAVQYDFIGKYETIKVDADYVLDWLGATDMVDGFPASDRPFHARRYDPKYFNQLSHNEKMNFFNKYLADFVAFDYEFV